MSRKPSRTPRITIAKTDPFGRRKPARTSRPWPGPASGTDSGPESGSASGHHAGSPSDAAGRTTASGAAARALTASRVLAHALTEIRTASMEILVAAHRRELLRRDRRHAFSHARMIAVYAAHVAGPVSMRDLAAATGRHPSTISAMIRLVEERRDEPGFDALVSGIEHRAEIIIRRSGLADAKTVRGEVRHG